MERLNELKRVILSTIIIFVLSITPTSVYSTGEILYYITFEGGMSESKWRNPHYLNFAIDKDYSLSGDLTNELFVIRYSPIIITGVIKNPLEIFTWGNIEVDMYRIKYLDKFSWITGELYESEDGLVLVGDDQFIYVINLLAELDESIINNRVGIRGARQYREDYTYDIEVYELMKLDHLYLWEDIFLININQMEDANDY